MRSLSRSSPVSSPSCGRRFAPAWTTPQLPTAARRADVRAPHPRLPACPPLQLPHGSTRPRSPRARMLPRSAVAGAAAVVAAVAVGRAVAQGPGQCAADYDCELPTAPPVCLCWCSAPAGGSARSPHRLLAADDVHDTKRSPLLRGVQRKAPPLLVVSSSVLIRDKAHAWDSLVTHGSGLIQRREREAEPSMQNREPAGAAAITLFFSTISTSGTFRL